MTTLILVGLIPAAPIFYFSFKYNEEAACLRAEKDLSQQISILADLPEADQIAALKETLRQIE